MAEKWVEKTILVEPGELTDLPLWAWHSFEPYLCNCMHNCSFRDRDPFLSFKLTCLKFFWCHKAYSLQSPSWHGTHGTRKELRVERRYPPRFHPVSAQQTRMISGFLDMLTIAVMVVLAQELGCIQIYQHTETCVLADSDRDTKHHVKRLRHLFM